MIAKFGIVALVILTSAAYRGYSPTTVRSGDSHALLYARGLATSHSAAIAAATANPSGTGMVAIAAAAVMPGLTVSACKDGTVVATWLVPNTYPSDLPIAARLMELTDQDPGAGTTSNGTVAAASGRFISLPCTIPDGIPVMVTAFRN